MFLRTSGNKAETSLPSVMAMMVFCIDSFRSHAYCETRPALNSKVSPLRGGAKAFFTLFIAMLATGAREVWVSGGGVERGSSYRVMFEEAMRLSCLKATDAGGAA